MATSQQEVSDNIGNKVVNLFMEQQHTDSSRDEAANLFLKLVGATYYGTNFRDGQTQARIRALFKLVPCDRMRQLCTVAIGASGGTGSELDHQLDELKAEFEAAPAI
jgi:hypothetical protein